MAKSKIGSIELDTLLSEKVSEPVQVTDHPIEEGANPSDHRRVLPVALTIEGVLTNTPLPEADRTARGAAERGATTGWAQRQYEALRALRLGELLTVQTPARKYQNMQITELARTRDSGLGTDTVQFTCQLKEVFVVKTDTVRLERVTKRTGIPKKPTNKEKQATQVASSESDAADKKTLFKKVRDTELGKSFVNWVTK